jgi:two-component system, cell cycle sensor histidine kinase and response regulator CckA
MATVLVVDDNDDVRQIATLALGLGGHQTLSASNGLEGLMVYSSYRRNIDLVLTDVEMPQMNGIELASRIRALDPARKILLMSGRSCEDIDGAQGYPFVPKPFVPDQLNAAVDALLKV